MLKKIVWVGIFVVLMAVGYRVVLVEAEGEVGMAVTITAVSHWEGNLWRPDATEPLSFETIEFDLTKNDAGVPQFMNFGINATHGTSSGPNELTCFSGGTASIANEQILTFIPFGQDIYYMQTNDVNEVDFWGGWNFDGYLGQDVFFNPTGSNEAEGTYTLHYNVPDGEGDTEQISCAYLWRAVCVSGCVPVDLEYSVYLPYIDN